MVAGPRWGRIGLVALLAAMAASVAVFDASARAETSVICRNFAAGSFGTCPPGPRHTLTGVTSWGDFGTCAGAWRSYPDDFYEGYACQGTVSHHPYNAGNLLYGAAHSNVSFSNHINGDETW